MDIARGPGSEAGLPAAGGFSRQAGTQGKAKILRTLLAAAFDTPVASTSKLISKYAWLQNLLGQRLGSPAPLIWPSGVQVAAGPHWLEISRPCHWTWLCLTTFVLEALGVTFDAVSKEPLP